VGTTPEGTPERIGRMLGRLVVSGRAAARQANTPEGREKLAAAARAAGEVAREKLGDHGPDVAEVAAQRAVDRAFWIVRARLGFLGAILDPVADKARQAAGAHARRLSSPPDPEKPADPQAPPG
jgi:hypothetical protein